MRVCTAKAKIYPNFTTHISMHTANNKYRRQEMKKTLLLGTMLGMVTATALYFGMSNNSVKKAKRAFVNKIEDILM